MKRFHVHYIKEHIVSLSVKNNCPVLIGGIKLMLQLDFKKNLDNL